MHLDARGLPISTASAKAAAAYDYLITGYLTQRADTPARLTSFWKPIRTSRLLIACRAISPC
jgi:hypothetical protein